MPDVCILLACCNNEKYVAALIDSLLSQSCGDFSLLARDDCSRDATADIVRSYDDPRIDFAVNPAPSGSAQNNFYSLLLARDDAPYTMFADADDVWFENKVERTLARMRECEAMYGKDTPILVHGDLTVTDEKLNVIAPSMFRYEKLSPQRTALPQLLAQNNVTGCTMMINRALAELIPRKPENSVMHDWYLALCASAFGHISVIDEPLLYYRQHSGNQVGAYDAADPLLAAKKLGNVSRTRAVYDAMFAQAGCFAQSFKEKLTPKQYELCTAYAALAGKNKLCKLACVAKYGFYKNTFIRNLGQCIAI